MISNDERDTRTAHALLVPFFSGGLFCLLASSTFAGDDPANWWSIPKVYLLK